MIVNQATLSSLFVGFKKVFSDTLQSTPDKFERIGTMIPATGASTDLPLVALAGSIREWIGDRQKQNLAAYKKNVTHRKFEQTVGVARTDIEDDNVGLYKPAIAQMAVKAKEYPYDLAITRLMTDGFTVAGLDGVALFNAAHTWAGSAYTTSQDNLTDEALDAAAVQTGVEAMLGFRGPDAGYLGVSPTDFICATNLWSTAHELFLCERNDAGASNPLYGLFDKDHIHVEPRVPSGRWAMLDCSKPIKPALHLKRTKIEFVALTNVSDENVFRRDEYEYGTRFRSEVAALHWWLCYGSTGDGG